MKLIDYFFYIISKSFTNRHSGLDDSDARMKGSAFLSLWLCAFIGTLLSCIGLIMDNPVSALLKNPKSEYIVAGFGVLLFILIQMRHWKPQRYIKMAEWRKGLSKTKSTIMYTLFIVFFWSMPIVFFITCRLYVFGQIKWW